MILIFGAAIFLSAVLLFLIQPMAAKLVLPILGGTPNVWNTAMVFFQTMLLFGYFYSHLITRRLRLPGQFIVHALLMGTVLLALPIGLPSDKWMPGSGYSPSNWLLIVLALIAGLPYFAVATTGPLLQAWFGATDDKRAKDPYFLYAASNAGSLLGLLAFPFFIEPNFMLSGQSEVWTIGYALLAALVLVAGARALKRRRETTDPASIESVREPLAWSRRFLWIALAAAPSSFSLGASTTITMDVAAVPLLWIIPLSVYLLSYILAFSARFPVSAVAAGRVAIVAVIIVVINHVYGAQYPLVWVVGAHLFALGTCAYACHRRLFELRPSPARLTEFYLLAAFGGALGGAFTALFAPVFFTFLLEYPLSMAACLLLLAPAPASVRTSVWKLAVYAVVAVVLLLLADSVVVRTAPYEHLYTIRAAAVASLCALFLFFLPGANFRIALVTIAVYCSTIFQYHATSGLIFAGRSFFGTYAIYNAEDHFRLLHGTTLHGAQFRSPDLAGTPGTYYNQKGPLGDIFAEMRHQSPTLRVAAIGLGVGTIAAYAQKGDHFTFYEIDPLVQTIATDGRIFTYIKDATARGATLDFVIGDGRLGIATSEKSFDLIILDAFSSDSVPVHLLTREALQIYAEHLAPNGLIAFHVSNRYFDIAMMCAQVAASNEMFAAMRFDRMKEPDADKSRVASDWVAVAPTTDTLRRLAARPEWFKIKIDLTQRAWTDSYSSLFDVHWK